MAIPPVTNLEVSSPGTGNLYMTWTNGDAYDGIRIIRDNGAGFLPYDNINGNETSYTDTEVAPNTIHAYKIQGKVTGEYVEPSDSDSSAYWTDTITDEIIVGDSVAEYATAPDVSDTVTDTIYVSDFVADATDIRTNYAYYMATADGKIYEYSDFYKSDGGTAITAWWKSKDTDFGDQSIENADKFKTVEFVRLHYVDKSAGALISIKLSTDGGLTWTTETKTIGNGDQKSKFEDFHFVKTSNMFTVCIENISTSDDFQWTGLEVFYDVGGDYFIP